MYMLHKYSCTNCQTFAANHPHKCPQTIPKYQHHSHVHKYDQLHKDILKFTQACSNIQHNQSHTYSTNILTSPRLPSTQLKLVFGTKIIALQEREESSQRRRPPTRRSHLQKKLKLATLKEGLPPVSSEGLQVVKIG